MTQEFNRDAPLQKTTEHNGHRLRRLFKWKRRDGKERHMVDWVFNGNVRNLFVLIATVAGIREIT